MHIENLIKQAEDLVFNIGQQAHHKDLHTSALSLLKGLYGLEGRYRLKEGECHESVTNEELLQIEKAKRKLQLWATNKTSIPALILIGYLSLKRPGSIAVINKKILEEAFKAHSNSSTFSKNFDQMKNFSEKNHAKIFDVSPRGLITIWSPVEEYVKAFEKEVFKN